jgi:hypothetical protein
MSYSKVMLKQAFDYSQRVKLLEYLSSKDWEKVKFNLSSEVVECALIVIKDMEDAGYTKKDLLDIKTLKINSLSKKLIKCYDKIGGEPYRQFMIKIFNNFEEPYIGDDKELYPWLKDTLPLWEG